MASGKLLVVLVAMVVVFWTIPYGACSCKIRTKMFRHRDVNWTKVFRKSVGHLLHKDKAFNISYCSGSCRYHRNPQYIYGSRTDTLTRARLEHSCSTNISCTAMKDLIPCCVPTFHLRVVHPGSPGESKTVILSTQKRTINITFLVGHFRKQIPYNFWEPTSCTCS